MNFWINTVSRDHLQNGIAGGFTQANHGKVTGLKRLRKGDRIVFYSPRTAYPDGAPLQRFTAVAEVVDDAPYQVQMTPDFHPWRRNVRFLGGDEVAIQELIAKLTFIKDKQQWGYPFRRGLFEIPPEDFDTIVAAMRVPR